MSEIEQIIDQMEGHGIRKVEYYMAGYWSIVLTDGSNMVIRREITEPVE